MIDHGINGFISKAPSIECIDEALEQAWENSHRWEEMGKVAFEMIGKKIDLNSPSTLLKCIENNPV